MIRIENSVVVNRPVEEVFDFVSDIENAPQWQTEVVEAKRTYEGPVRVGGTSTQVRQFLGQRIESSSEVTEYEPNRKLGGKSMSGPMPFEASITFESLEDVTKISVIIEAEPGGLFKLAEPLVGRAAQRQWDTNLANLKDLLETQSGASS